jgi:hypothetical protein
MNEYSTNDIDLKEVNQQLNVLIGESTPFSRDKVEEIDARFSFSREVVVVQGPLSGMERHHEIDTSNSDKELVPSKNQVLCI